MSLDKMLEEFKTVAELQTFAEAQYKTIQDLTKKNKLLKDDNTSLQKKLLDSGKDMSSSEEKTPSIVSNLISTCDEEIIAKVQLAKLKEVSFEREMTLEEAKRTEIFSKILTSLRDGNKKSAEAEYKKLDDSQILRLLDNGTEQSVTN